MATGRSSSLMDDRRLLTRIAGARGGNGGQESMHQTREGGGLGREEYDARRERIEHDRKSMALAMTPCPHPSVPICPLTARLAHRLSLPILIAVS